LIATVDSDVWGKPYKIVMRRLRRPRPIPGIELPGRLKGIVNGLFPQYHHVKKILIFSNIKILDEIID
jgi:hypothetical protein